MDIKPSQTLYLNNLNEKIKKNDLKKALYYLFCSYGRMIDIIAMKTIKMRGQAFIIFADINSATTALKMLQGFHLFQKPIRIQYARKESTQISRDRGYGQAVEVQKKKEEERERRRKKKLAQKAQMVAAPAQLSSAQPPSEVSEPSKPNNVLFVKNLPEETTEAMLTMLFSQFSGFQEARKATGGVAFIEYENDDQAYAAQVAYNGFKLTPSHALDVSYAKK